MFFIIKMHSVRRVLDYHCLKHWESRIPCMELITQFMYGVRRICYSSRQCLKSFTCSCCSSLLASVWLFDLEIHHLPHWLWNVLSLMQPSKLCLFSNDTINSNMRPPYITQCIVVRVTESIYIELKPWPSKRRMPKRGLVWQRKWYTLTHKHTR